MEGVLRILWRERLRINSALEEPVHCQDIVEEEGRRRSLRRK